MVAQHKTELIFDGDGRPVMEKAGYRSFHVNSPPSGEITTSPKMFQVWSSVLKKSLTSVAPDGTKRETKVYAGAAAIAYQTRWGQNDNIKWATADPVTGTTGTFFYNTSLTFSKGESEPFGQSVAGSDPYLPDPPEPPLENPPPLNDAGEPEWQCLAPREFWGGFTGLPFHCQKALLQDLSVSLGELYGFSNLNNPSSPKILDSPIERFEIPGVDDAGGSPHNLVLAAMLNPTSKKDDKKPKPVPESNLPKDPDVDLENLIVTVRAGTSIIDEVNAHFDASNGGGMGGNYDAAKVLKAVNKAIEMTDPTKHKKCDQALKSSGIPSLNALVKQYKDAQGNLANISDGSTTAVSGYGVDSAAIPAFVTGIGSPNRHTGINSAFFADVSLGSDAARAIIIIHEAVHQFANRPDSDFDATYNPGKISRIQSTKKRQEKIEEHRAKGSVNITTALIDNCWPVLRALPTQLSGI